MGNGVRGGEEREREEDREIERERASIHWFIPPQMSKCPTILGT